jgi:hypothetical protein
MLTSLLIESIISNIKQIPLLVVIILAMLYNRVPQAWSGASAFLSSVRNPADANAQPRIIEVAQ